MTAVFAYLKYSFFLKAVIFARIENDLPPEMDSAKREELKTKALALMDGMAVPIGFENRKAKHKSFQRQVLDAHRALREGSAQPECPFAKAVLDAQKRLWETIEPLPSIKLTEVSFEAKPIHRGDIQREKQEATTNV